MKKTSLTVLAASLLPLALMAQISIDSHSTAYIENFDLGETPNVKRAIGSPSVEGSISIAEPGNWAMTGETNRYAFNSLFAAQSDTSTPFAAPFTSDFNNDTNDTSRNDLHGRAQYIDSSVLPALGASNGALMKPENTWADSELTFRFVNNTGQTINQWEIGLDTWWNDAGLANSGNTLSLMAGTAYDPTGSGMSLVDSSASPNTNGGWTSVDQLSGNISLSVADGDSIYVQLFYDQNSNGNAVAWDNLSVMGVPEPTTYGLLAGFGALALAWMRRKR